MRTEEDRGLLLDTPDTSLSQEEIALCNNAISTLKDPQRTAFLMKNYYGWPIESIDANCESISSYYNVDPRTVRYWLSQAEKDLLKWRKGERQ
jgi:DNA-directed RNA polymerase specialized sigma24 family protein